MSILKTVGNRLFNQGYLVTANTPEGDKYYVRWGTVRDSALQTMEGGPHAAMFMRLPEEKPENGSFCRTKVGARILQGACVVDWDKPNVKFKIESHRRVPTAAPRQ